MPSERREQASQRAQHDRAFDRGDEAIGRGTRRVVIDTGLPKIEVDLRARNAVQPLKSPAHVRGAGAAKQPIDAQRGARGVALRLDVGDGGVGLNERSMRDDPEHPGVV